MNLSNFKKKDLINLGTSLTFGSFVICSFTGIAMYFDLLSGGMQETHEILGLIFCVAVGIHLLGHIKSVPKYFKRYSSLSIISSMLAIGIVNIYLTFDDLPSGKVAFKKFSNTKIKYLIPVIGKSKSELTNILKENNVSSINFDKSFREISEENNIELHDILEPVLN